MAETEKKDVVVKFACEVRNQKIMIECGYSHLEMGKRVVEKKTRFISFKDGLFSTSDPVEIKFIKSHHFFTDPNPRIIEIKAGTVADKDRLKNLMEATELANRATAKAQAQAAEANGKLGQANKKLKEMEELNKKLEAEKKSISVTQPTK